MHKPVIAVFAVQPLAVVLLAFAWALMAPQQAFAKPVSSGALGVCQVDGGHIWFTQTKKWCCATYQSGPDNGKKYCITCVHDANFVETCEETTVTSRPITPGGTRR